VDINYKPSFQKVVVEGVLGYVGTKKNF